MMLTNNTTKQLRLRHWITLGYVVPILTFLVAVVVTDLNIRRVKAVTAERDRAGDANQHIGKISFQIQVASRSTRGYLLDPSPVSFQSFQAAREAYEQEVADIRSLIIDPRQQENLAKLAEQTQQLMDINEGLITMASQGRVDEAIDLWKRESARDLAEKLTALLAEMEDIQAEIVDTNKKLSEAALANLQRTVFAACIITILFSLAVGSWIINKASQQMSSSSALIAASTTEIAATVQQQERTAQQQAASVNETTATMDELGASSRQSAEQAEAAAAGARQALEMAEAGTQAVDRTLQGMDALMIKVQAISDQILRLSEQTSQIGSISGLVSDLANQTNMLALNAAVEAVRAGEHGKGFAVVSGEIRKLADQSKNSAEKINALVQDIQNAINSTVMATDEGSKTVEEGVRIAQETATAFAGVTDAVNNVVINSQQISLNVKQQATAIQQVVTAMNNLNTAAQETAGGISQVRLGTERLNEAAVNLQTVV
ncbi:MAG: methyl-accepting chemotaxis protein [Prochlorothrix sp.]|nr:methyl-accepting chemotaxis protein [Prochlorothrix sp.]